MLPNFLIIGAPRSGTDFLFYSLAKHPQICIAKERELHFFDRNFKKGLSWYESYFTHCNADNIIGEKTANYLVNSESAKRIKMILGNVKLISILRNPIERAYSHYRNWVGLRKIDVQTSFRKCIHLYPEILVMGNYYDHFKRYLEYFKMEEDLIVVFFDELFDSPFSEYKKVLSFLGITDDFELPEVKKYNPSTKLYKIGKNILSKREISRIRKLFPHGIANKFLYLLEHKFGSINQEDRGYLREYYYHLNEKLFDLLDIRKDWND